MFATPRQLLNETHSDVLPWTLWKLKQPEVTMVRLFGQLGLLTDRTALNVDFTSFLKPGQM